MSYDYEAELGRVGKGGQKVMVLVGEKDEAVGPEEVLRGVAGRIPGCKYVMVKCGTFTADAQEGRV